MSLLANHQWEKFCQELHRRELEGMAAKQARDEAYAAAGYLGQQKYLSANARKLTQKPEIKKRLGELRTRSAELAEIDAGWCLLKLKRRVELIDDFNLDDYLTEAVADGAARYFDISQASRDQLARLSELNIEEEILDAGEETMRHVRKTRLKGHTDIEAAIGLIARIQGYAKPDKVAFTDPSGKNAAPPITTGLTVNELMRLREELTAERARRLDAGGGAGIEPPPPAPALPGYGAAPA